MQIDVAERNGAAVVRPLGARVDLQVAGEFRTALLKLIEVGQYRLVVDMGDVHFVDSSGLGAIISGLKLARQAGGDLRIACANQQVLVVLDLTSLNQVLQPYPSVQEALTDF